VPGRCAGRIDIEIGMQAAFVHEVLKNTLSRRAAADITETDEYDFVWIFFGDWVLGSHN